MFGLSESYLNCIKYRILALFNASGSKIPLLLKKQKLNKSRKYLKKNKNTDVAWSNSHRMLLTPLKKFCIFSL